VTEERTTVWERPERGTRGPSPGHSRTRITEVAVRLADAGGLSAVTLRRVAGELGTGPASLYRYVVDRDDLLDLMTDAAAGEIDLSVPLTGDPAADLVALAVRSKEVHLRHPWLLDVPPEPARTGPRGLDHLEYALGALAPVRLPGPAKLETVAMLNALVAALARAELGSGRTPTSRQRAQAAYLAGAARDGARPRLAAALAEQPGGEPGEEPHVRFERAIRRALAGLLRPAT